MPPAPSIISRQFTPVDADGRTLMVLCNHCRTTRVPKNSLVRKENHLRVCQDYHITAAALRQQQHQQQQQNSSTTSTTTPTLTNNTTGLDDTNNTTNTLNQHHDTFDSDSPSDDQQNVIGSPLANNISTPAIHSDVLPLDILEHSILARANRSKPGNSKEARLSASGRQSSSIADDIYSGVPYAYPLPYTSEPASLRSLIATDESRKRRRETGSPGLPNEGGSPGREGGGVVRGGTGAKRLKYAEFYLDEEDYDFVCDARGAREERFREIVERLARLIRLRDTRGP